MTQLGIKFYDVKWNDKNYHNDWFEVDGFDIDEHIDIDALLTEQDNDCNESEGRTDLIITNYEYKIYSY